MLVRLPLWTRSGPWIAAAGYFNDPDKSSVSSRGMDEGGTLAFLQRLAGDPYPQGLEVIHKQVVLFSLENQQVRAFTAPLQESSPGRLGRSRLE
jgi:hypothetical protein